MIAPLARITLSLLIWWIGVACATSVEQATPTWSEAAEALDPPYVGQALTQQPELANRPEIRGIVQRELSAAMLETQRGNTIVLLSIVIDDAGAVERVWIEQSSGSLAMDTAARNVALRMVFIPGKIDEAPVRVRVLVPVTLQIR